MYRHFLQVSSYIPFYNSNVSMIPLRYHSDTTNTGLITLLHITPTILATVSMELLLVTHKLLSLIKSTSTKHR